MTQSEGTKGLKRLGLRMGMEATGKTVVKKEKKTNGDRTDTNQTMSVFADKDRGHMGQHFTKNGPTKLWLLC